MRTFVTHRQNTWDRHTDNRIHTSCVTHRHNQWDGHYDLLNSFQCFFQKQSMTWTVCYVFFLGIEMLTITARLTRTGTSNNYKPYKNQLIQAWKIAWLRKINNTEWDYRESLFHDKTYWKNIRVKVENCSKMLFNMPMIRIYKDPSLHQKNFYSINCTGSKRWKYSTPLLKGI